MNAIASAVDMTDLLLWDAREKEWRIGHKRTFFTGVEHWCACSVRDANDLIEDEQPIPVFTEVTHWAALPQPITEE